MISLRRYAIYFGLVGFVLLFFNYISSDTLSGARINYSSWMPELSTKSHGPFRWADVPVRYPVSSLTALPTGTPKTLPKVQFDFPKESKAHADKRNDRRARVKATFERCWNAYKEHAWMKDELAPLSGGFKDSFGGWAATLVDSLDTLWIMGMQAEFEEAVEAVGNIDLGISTNGIVNVFETTIRYLGGLLSAYDLSGDQRLLVKATEFGEMLLKAFDTPNRMPITRWKPQEALRHKQKADDVVLAAEIGSLSMEFTHLSQLTGDMRWYDAVDRITKLFAAQQEQTQLPGMWPVSVNARDADLTVDTFFSLGAMSDSLYEYFPKMYALMGGLEPTYSLLYSRSMQTAIKNLLWKPMTPDDADIVMAGNVRASNFHAHYLEPQGQHLVCFVGGMFALGGRIFNDENQVKLAKKLTDGCIWAYRAMPMGIMPEVFTMLPCASRIGSCERNETAWKEKVLHMGGEGKDADAIIKNERLPPGFTAIRDARYVLRPEAIESIFILYRTTGEEYLLETAWEMFNSIIQATESDIANAALADVTRSQEELNRIGAQVKTNSMESFWMAETLKYFYLIFSEPDVIDLDKWVFNTEAHPFKRLLPT